jgi:hypothetical protein
MHRLYQQLYEEALAEIEASEATGSPNGETGH